MIKLNQWYKLNEKEFTDILRFVKLQFPKLVNDEKYIESLNRVADAFTNNKVLYLQLKYHFIDGSYIAWHYRTSYSEFYCGECLKYTDIILDEPKLRHEYEIEVIDDMIANDDKQSLEQRCKAFKKLITNSVYGAFDGRLGAPLYGNKENKGDNKMRVADNQEEAMSSLMRNYYEKEEKRIDEECKARVYDIRVNSEAMKAVSKIYDIAIKNGNEINCDFRVLVDCVPFNCLTKTELAAIENEKVMAEEAIKELKERCRECRNLLTLCDTFEERKKLLKKYKIIQ